MYELFWNVDLINLHRHALPFAPFKQVVQKFEKILNIREDPECIASSCAKDFINFSACAGECLLKNEEQNF